jgi:hypothetical protein
MNPPCIIASYPSPVCEPTIRLLHHIQLLCVNPPLNYCTVPTSCMWTHHWVTALYPSPVYEPTIELLHCAQALCVKLPLNYWMLPKFCLWACISYCIIVCIWFLYFFKLLSTVAVFILLTLLMYVLWFLVVQPHWCEIRIRKQNEAIPVWITVNITVYMRWVN